MHSPRYRGASTTMRGGFTDPFEIDMEREITVEDIPTMDSVVLTGLDFSMRPERVRYEVAQGFIRPLSEANVKHQIKCLAILVYNQMYFTPTYHGRICGSRSPLAFFLCAVHRQQAPQPKTHSRQNSRSSQIAVSDSSGKVICKSPAGNGKKYCELPKLTSSSMLPLGNWDCLYYALVAEIHKLHSDLQERFGFGCENGTKPLHCRGRDGTKQDPVTAIDLASLLETACYALMDNRLVAALDSAVRKKNFVKLQTTGDLDSGDRPPVLYGLIDVNALDPDAIIQLLWEKYRAEVDAACLENFEDESMLSEHHAQQYRYLVEQSTQDELLSSAVRACKCHRACVCKLKCDNTTEGCTCDHAHVYHRLTDEHDETGSIIIKYIKEDANNPQLFVGSTSNTLAQMLIPRGTKQRNATSTSRNISNGIVSSDTNSSGRERSRANTNNSDLAYVPGEPSSRRTTNDTYPLGFYGRGSGQRYPTNSSQGTAVSSRRPSADQGATPLSVNRMPSRKPVPTTPISPVTPAPVSYPTIPASQSHSMFTQSFPVPGASNPRDFGDETVNDDKSKRATANVSQYAANDYVNLLSEHPSSINEHHDNDTEPFPKLTRAITTSPPRKTKSVKPSMDTPRLKHSNTTNGAVTTVKTFDKPTPILPEPDFIAPKVAVKQRYVSAGGNTPLSERTEIPGPAFHTATPSPPTGRAITKEELDAKLSDPEWVRRNFGEDAVVAMCTPPRASGEEGPRDSKQQSRIGSKRNSGRKSDESDRDTPRDRTSSSAGKREKLKRLFSRQGSINEANQ